ncbi:hypothetical protein HSX37_11165|uniref:Uncharacterized protein n=1 Tax=Dendrosporobacter quercicolus TaxID=146817 RepID=A0A1G9SWU4_9FIRM|nr:hypothetical protein [Dendrosporobacter quercicolus]NSL48592.1 hypothetical protein [Dendrosporobacter quercicolus DSM 1736]SDM39817.1 hypothetical protein SAMN04488502_104140 [Dendrosporobacter quercicolus]
MKAVLMAAFILLGPSIAFAHSGTALKTVAGYLPLLLAAVPMLAAFGLRLMKKIVMFFRKRH